jgi:hypothetical protein
MRLCIATKNEMYEQVPAQQLVGELELLFNKHAFFDQRRDTLLHLLEVVLNSSGLNLVKHFALASGATYSLEEWALFKGFVVRRLLDFQLHALLMTALDNFRLLSFLQPQKTNIHDYVSMKYKSFGRFVARVMTEFKAAGFFAKGQEDIKVRAAEFMLRYLFNTNEVCFTRLEVAFIIDDPDLDEPFYNGFFIHLLKLIRAEGFPEELQARLVPNFKRLRRACLKKTPHAAAIIDMSAVLTKHINRMVAIWGSKITSFCSSASIAYYICKEELLDTAELKKIHQPL